MNSEVLHSDMLTKLLIYLLIHREQPVSVDALAEALWNEGETDNPAGALKNLMYRLRTILNKAFGTEDYILTSRGIYGWNPEKKVQIDIEEFEKLCQKAKKEKSESKQKADLEKAIALYHGDFMPRIMERHWVMTLSTYYHSMLNMAVKTLIEIYEKEESYEEVERLCMYSLELDPLDEWMHCTLINSLMKQKQNKLAMEHYNEATKLLREELGIRHSEQLEAMYKQLIQTSKGSEAEKIQNVHDDVIEKGVANGAYICGYPVFCEVYRIEARRIGRLGEAEYLALISLQLKEKHLSAEQEKMGRFLIEKGMNELEDILRHSLRGGDVASRYSDSQFVVLLPTCTYESCLSVSERILDRFYKKDKGNRIEITVDFEEVADATLFLS